MYLHGGVITFYKYVFVASFCTLQCTHYIQCNTLHGTAPLLLASELGVPSLRPELWLSSETAPVTTFTGLYRLRRLLYNLSSLRFSRSSLHLVVFCVLRRLFFASSSYFARNCNRCTLPLLNEDAWESCLSSVIPWLGETLSASPSPPACPGLLLQTSNPRFHGFSAGFSLSNPSTTW